MATGTAAPESQNETEEFVVDTLEEAYYTVDGECGNCDRHGMHGSIHVRGSRFYEIAAYEWHRDGRSARRLRRPGRNDYWEGLIHFCTRDQFISIFETKRILAAPTGYYKHKKPDRAAAVCLTETPINECDELVKTHGEFGYVFRKKDIIWAGGAPAIYLTESLIHSQERADGFSAELVPFINLIRIAAMHGEKPKYDFLHEREWRIAGDIDLTEVKPFGVVVPGRTGFDKFRGPGWRKLLSAASQFEELDIEGRV